MSPIEPMANLEVGMSKPETMLLGAGVALCLVLLGIGVASHEMIRHLVQAAPSALFCAVGVKRPAWLRWLLGPVFFFWLAISVLIGLFLFGIAHIITGTFSVWERALTGGLAIVSIAGFGLFVRIHRPIPILSGLGLSVAAFALQVGALALSMQPAIAHR